MLDSLDILISFVLIMLVVSLLITIAVQVTSAVLNLRGHNLAKGLERTFTAVAPGIEQNAKELARFVTKGPLVSDSFLPDLPVLRWWRTPRQSGPKKPSMPFTELRPAADLQVQL